MKNKVCIVVTIITFLMLAQFSLFIRNVKAVEIYGLTIEKPYNSYYFKVGENITDYLVYIDKSTGEKIPIKWENIKVVNEVDNGVIEVDGKNAIVKREGKSAISYYDGDEIAFTLEVTAVDKSTEVISEPKVYVFINYPLIKTKEKETGEIFTYLAMEPVDQDFNWDIGLPEVNLEWTVANPQIAQLEETTKYDRGIVIKPLKRGNTKLTCTVEVPTTGETIVKNAYIMVADENGNYDQLVEDNTEPEILNIQVNGYTIKVEAKDDKAGLAEKAYSLAVENWQSSNEFVVNKSGKYTIYVRDIAGNIATKTVEVVDKKEEDDKTEKENKTSIEDDKTKKADKTSTEDDKMQKEDKTPVDNDNKNNNSKNADNKTPIETNNAKKAEDKTQAKTVIPQTGATFPIVILIVISVIGIVGYKKFKRINY